ncbi:hypothetical protein [Marinicella sp. W31]|uniref:hypothetical protein n=1 Tax=Marinicella sp. W31 TaxID=3023713 RepID=UPI00375652BE
MESRSASNSESKDLTIKSHLAQPAYTTESNKRRKAIYLWEASWRAIASPEA